MNEIRHGGENSPNLECCAEFRKAELKVFLRHLHERKCERCWAFFQAVEQGTANGAISVDGQKGSKPVAGGAAPSNDRTIDHWLTFEYRLIPQRERPMAGSNEWFRWLEEFQERHPVEVSQLKHPLSDRACRVLWNSK